MGTRILIINLDAMGDVLRTTAILVPLKRKYKTSHVTWLTGRPSLELLKNNPYIDRLLDYSVENITGLLVEKFDVLMGIDKSQRAGSLAMLVSAKEKLGFGITEAGAICPLNKEAESLYELGLDDEKKFKLNKKSQQELLCEALGLKYRRDEYILELTDDEKKFICDFRNSLNLNKEGILIGFNTGCSNKYPYKKLTFNKQAELITSLLDLANGAGIALLGGREDTENIALLKARFKDRIISTPTDKGLRKGILFIGACDYIITGDTLAAHIAIALKKPAVVWFSISCENEIDLYGRGAKILSDIDCRPCWKSHCLKQPKCNETVDVAKICTAVKTVMKDTKKCGLS